MKHQSAIEFLMTYGWAILVIAVIIGLLFQLGVFSPSLPASCISGAPFFCSNPILYSNHTLAVQIGELGSTMTVTNLNCTASDATPEIFTQTPQVKLISGTVSTLRFTCPLTSNAVGTSFSGKLWIYYYTPSQNDLISKVGTFTATVTMTGPPTNAYAQPYVLTMIAGPGGAVMPPTDNYSGSVQISAAPNPGYIFANWTGKGPGSYTGTSSTASVTMDYNITETATFALQSYQFTAVAGAGGNVTCAYALNATPTPCSAMYKYGTQISVAASPALGYNFANWTCAGNSCSTTSTSPTIVTIGAYNTNVTANFGLQDHAFSATAGTGGSVSCAYASNSFATPCIANYTHGTAIEVTATPGAGYGFTSWTCAPGTACSSTSSNPTTATTTSATSLVANFAINSYMFTATNGLGGGNVTCSFTATNVVTPCSKMYLDGTEINVTATPYPGYAFTGWTCTGSACNPSSVSPTTVNVVATTQVTADFTSEYYSFAATPSAGGTVSCEYASNDTAAPCTSNYTYGTEIVANASADEGYAFSGWACAPSAACSAPSSMQTAITADSDTSAVAEFAIHSYQFTAVNGLGGGSVTCSYALNGTPAPCDPIYPYGTQISVAAVPNSSYIFSGWTCTGSACTPTATSPTIVTLGASNTVVTASFSIQPQSFSATAGTGGTVSCAYASNAVSTSCAANYPVGTQLSLAATPNAGYAFTSWTCTGSACAPSSSSPTTVMLGASTTSVVANFATQSYSLTATSGLGGGNVTCSFTATNVVTSCSSNYPYGTRITVAAVPNSGNSFTGWTGIGQGSYTGTLNPANLTVNGVMTETAAFATRTYSFSAMNSTVGGSVSCTSGGSSVSCSGNYAYGKRINMTATPSAGYAFAGWVGTGTGSYSGASNPANVTVVSAMTEAASFATQSDSFSATAGTGGAVSCAYTSNGVNAPCSGSYAQSTQISVTATPLSGNAFTGWTCTTGICSTLTTSPTIATITSTANVVAAFAVQTHSFSATAGTGGSVSCAYTSNSVSTPCSANYVPGTSITITAAPNEGYSFESWSCAGSSCVPTTSSPTTVTIGTGTTLVVASFAVNSYSFAATATTGGTVFCTIEGTASSCIADYPYGTQYVVAAIPNTGYSFTYWTCTGACSPTSVSPTMVTIGDFPNNVLANFAINYYVFSATAGTGGTVSCAYASNGTATSCSTGYPYGTQLIVTATPASGYILKSWACTSGACSTTSSSPTAVTISSATSVSAAFVTQVNSFSATAGTGGTVSCEYVSNSVSIPCTGNYTYSTQISVAATAGTGYAFTGWTCTSGACSTTSSSPTVVTAGTGTSVVAYFAIQSYSFSATAGSGGSVSCTVGGVSSSCSSNYPYGTQIVVTEMPSTGYAFSSWTCTSGACSTTSSSPTTVTIGAAATSVVASFAIQSYQFAATAGAGGSVTCSPSCSGTYAYGTPITVTATPNTGYLFSAWICTGSTCSPASSSPTTVALGAAPTSVIAEFAAQPYSFSATAGSGGTVSCAYNSNSVSTSCSANYTRGTAIKVTATAGSGYAFTTWTCTSGDCNTLTASPTVATVGAGTASVVAGFSPIPYSFTAGAVPGAYGYVTCSGQGSSCSTTYAYGTQETVSAHPYSGYYILGWTCTGTGVTCSGTGSSQTVTMTIGGATIAADFAPIPYSFSATTSPSTAGTVSCSGGGATSCSMHSYSYGNAITVTATPLTGNTFSSWTCAPSGACSPSGSTVSVTVPIGGVTVTANFQEITETLIVNNNGCASVSGAGTYNYGTAVQFSATVPNGYSFIDWTGSGTGNYAGTNNPCSVTMNSPITETAVCTSNPYYFSANALPSNEGSVSCSGQGTSCTGTYPYGTQETVTASPITGYTVLDWTCTGTGVTCTGAGTTQTVTIPAGGATLTVDFTQILYSFLAGALPAADGTVSCSGAGTSCSTSYPFNSQETVTAFPITGYSVSGWTCSGTGVTCTGTGTTQTVTMPVNGATMYADFEINSYVLTTSPGVGGSITCGGSPCASTYQYDSQFTANAFPANGYTFTSLSCAPSAACSISGTNVMVTMPASAVTITAAFTANTYSFTANPGVGGTIACGGSPCAATYSYNSVVAVTGNPTNGYSFSSWTCNPPAVCSTTATTPTQVTIPIGGVTVNAIFAANSYLFTANNSIGGKILCNGAACLASYNYNTILTATASTYNGYTFTSLSCAPSTACSVSGATATVTMPAAALTVTAAFTANMYSFSAVASPTADGSVSCSSGSCLTANYPYGNSIIVSATPVGGYSFNGWNCNPTGACSTLTQSPTTVNVPIGGAAVTANFITQSYSFNAVAGTGGTVACSGQGSSCNANYPYNSVETVTATPISGNVLISWACIPGSACATGTPATQTVNVPINGVQITANFGAYTCPSANGLTCTKTTYGANIILTFTGVGATYWTVPSWATTVSYLVVAGGGGGGYNWGGGGGAGGYLAGNLTVAPGNVVLVKVGGGGGGAGGGGCGGSGGNSVFSTVNAFGGGGGSSQYYNACNGGSGGGAGGSGSWSGGQGTSGQGNAGGSSGGYGGGGGGGAGAVGAYCSSSCGGGNGGTGLQSNISGTPTYYAGGGCGGAGPNISPHGAGGSGGGGSGSGYGITGGSATFYGGGGGGGGQQFAAGGPGYAGIVIISILT